METNLYTCRLQILVGTLYFVRRHMWTDGFIDVKTRLAANLKAWTFKSYGVRENVSPWPLHAFVVFAPFVFHSRKKVTQVWNNMRLSKAQVSSGHWISNALLHNKAQSHSPKHSPSLFQPTKLHLKLLKLLHLPRSKWRRTSSTST